MLLAHSIRGGRHPQPVLEGGAERVVVNLCNKFVNNGDKVGDLIVLFDGNEINRQSIFIDNELENRNKKSFFDKIKSLFNK